MHFFFFFFFPIFELKHMIQHSYFVNDEGKTWRHQAASPDQLRPQSWLEVEPSLASELSRIINECLHR